MDFFLGKFNNTIDENNRLSIPAKFRKVLDETEEDNLIISKEQENYLILYPYKSWKIQVAEKITVLKRSDAKANRLRRLLGMSTMDAKPDKQGRVNIPSEYYEHAGIDKNVLIIGSIDTIQLWDPDTYASISQTPEENSLQEEYEEFGI